LGKGELVDALVSNFGLKVQWDDVAPTSNSISKQNYFSHSGRLREYGFTNSQSALQMVLEEFEAIVNPNLG
jgi:hypothetical protein